MLFILLWRVTRGSCHSSNGFEKTGHEKATWRTRASLTCSLPAQMHLDELGQTQREFSLGLKPRRGVRCLFVEDSSFELRSFVWWKWLAGANSRSSGTPTSVPYNERLLCSFVLHDDFW